MNAYNFNHFYYFYITAKLEGVTVAAKHLNTSQSSLSIQIKTLEATVGRKLFKKSGRKIVLTEDGREIFAFCRRAFGVFDEMFDRLSTESSNLGLRVSLGCSMEIERPFVADVITNIIKKSSKSRSPLIHFVSHPVEKMIEMLRLGELDLLLATKAPVDRDIEIMADLKVPVSAYASASLIKKIGKSNLKGVGKTDPVPILLPSKRLLLRAEIDAFLLKRKLNTQIVFESDVLSTLTRAAAEGLGIVILPECYTVDSTQRRSVNVLERHLWQHRIMVVGSRARLEDERRVFAKEFIENLANKIRHC